MGYFDEKMFINKNITKYEERLESSVTRFLDTTPVHVTYYNINTIVSTTDNGTLNVDRILSDISPIRFNGVRELPMYGIDNISPQLEDMEEGLNYRYEGDGILLPNTVRPKPDDFFTMDTLGKIFIFRVTAFEDTTIKSNSYVRISFMLYAVDEKINRFLEKQTVNWFKCFTDNIGTENKVLIQEDSLDRLVKLQEIYNKVSEYYRMLYFDKRYNSFLYNMEDGYRLYDRLLTRFMIRNHLFSNKDYLSTIVLSEEDDSNDIELEYYRSIFNAIEERDPTYLQHVMYMGRAGTNSESVFYHWRDRNVVTSRTGIGCKHYIRPEVVDLLLNAKSEVDNYQCKRKEYNDSLINQTCEEDGGYIELPDKSARPIKVSTREVPLDPYVIEEETIRLEIDEVDNTFNVVSKGKEPHVIPPIIGSDKVKPSSSGLDMDSLFDDDDDTPELPPVILPEIGTESEIIPIADNVHIKKTPTSTVLVETDGDLVKTEPVDNDLDLIVIKEQHKELDPSKWQIHVDKIRPEYIPPDIPAEGESIIVNIILLYLGGCDMELDDETLNTLSRPHIFMVPNHETFLLTPTLLYILEKIINSITRR